MLNRWEAGRWLRSCILFCAASLGGCDDEPQPEAEPAGAGDDRVIAMAAAGRVGTVPPGGRPNIGQPTNSAGGLATTGQAGARMDGDPQNAAGTEEMPSAGQGLSAGVQADRGGEMGDGQAIVAGSVMVGGEPVGGSIDGGGPAPDSLRGGANPPAGGLNIAGEEVSPIAGESSSAGIISPGGRDDAHGGFPSAGGAVTIEGCSKPVYNLSNGRIGPDRFRLAGEFRLNTFEGECADEGVRGADALLSFTAPSGGEWFFSTRGTDVYTVFYALESCDAGESDNPLVCVQDVNADAFLEHSEFRLFLNADEQVFLVVDRYASFARAPFVVSAERFMPGLAPRLESVSAFRSQTGEAIGLKLSGVDQDADVWSVGYSFWRGEVQLSPRIKYVQVPAQTYDENGGFNILTSIQLTAAEQAADFDTVRAFVVDARNGDSDIIAAALGSRDDVDPNGGCDGGLFGCAADEVCIQGRCADVGALVECGAPLRPVELNIDGVGRAEYTGNTDGQTGSTGSCIPNADDVQILRFVPPARGAYLVAVDGLSEDGEIAPIGADPVLLVRRFCSADVDEHLAELLCEPRPDRGIENWDTFVSGPRSVLARLELDADVPAFISVGGGGGWRGRYQLRIIPELPPTDLAARFVVDVNDAVLALRVSGRDIDPAAIHVRFFSDNGAEIENFDGSDHGWILPFEHLTVEADGEFVGYALLPMGDDARLITAASAQIAVSDERGLLSQAIDIDEAQPDNRLRDQPCDGRRQVDRCTGNGMYCVPLYNDCEAPCGRVEPTRLPFACRMRNEPPQLQAVEAYLRRDALTHVPKVELSVMANDLDGIDGYRLVFLDGNDEQVFVSLGDWDLIQRTENDGYQLSLTMDFPALRDLLFQNVTIQLSNIVGLFSQAEEIQFAMSSPAGVDESCESAQVECAVNLACVPESGGATCRVVAQACPVERNVNVVVEEVPGALIWRSDGVLAMDHPQDAGTCTEASPTQVFEITHSDGGALTCVIDSGQFQPVSWVRWACPQSDREFEMSCEATYMDQDGAALNTIGFYAPPNRPMYLMVGSANGEFGEFRLNCRPTDTE